MVKNDQNKKKSKKMIKIPKKRKFLLYNCVLLLTEKIDYSIPIIHDKTLLTKIQDNIFKISKPEPPLNLNEILVWQ